MLEPSWLLETITTSLPQAQHNFFMELQQQTQQFATKQVSLGDDKKWETECCFLLAEIAESYDQWSKRCHRIIGKLDKGNLFLDFFNVVDKLNKLHSSEINYSMIIFTEKV